MKVLRLAWSSYQSSESLEREKNQLEDKGFRYRQTDTSGSIPNDITEFDVIIINSQFKVNKTFLQTWDHPGLIIVASNGYDQINLEACDKFGVQVARTPNARSSRVVEHTMSFIFSLLRDQPSSNHAVRSGEWPRKNAFNRIHRLSSLTVGILGFGVIGQKVANRLNDFDPFGILANDPRHSETVENCSAVKSTSFEDLLNNSNIVTIHASANKKNNNLLDADNLKKLKSPSYLINTARGNLVNFNELIQLLEEGDLQSAAIDVFPEEPPSFSGDNLPKNLLTTPHSAGFGPGMLSDLRDEIQFILESKRNGQKLEHEVVSP